MATCKVLGQEEPKAEDLKRIELRELLLDNGIWSEIHSVNNLHLITAYDFFQLNPSYKVKEMDIITAREIRTGKYRVWLGHWNDGVA